MAGDVRRSRRATGHRSGRRIVAILEKKKAELSEDDYAHMRKVVGYAKRHSAQRPEGVLSQAIGFPPVTPSISAVT